MQNVAVDYTGAVRDFGDGGAAGEFGDSGDDDDGGSARGNRLPGARVRVCTIKGLPEDEKE